MKIFTNDQFGKQYLRSYNIEDRTLSWTSDPEVAQEFSDEESTAVLEWLTETMDVHVRTQ